MIANSRESNTSSIVNGIIVGNEDFVGIPESDAYKKCNVGICGHIALQIIAKTEAKPEV